MAGAQMPCPQATQRDQLIALLAADHVDAAIEAGLMAFVPCEAPCCGEHVESILRAQDKLRDAWAARDRYRARARRVQRRAAEREARRVIPQASVASEAPKPSLPASAAAILARAKAKAAGHSTDGTA